MGDPRVLIGLLSYNREQYKEECIESVLNQSYPCSLFITDDGSTDGSKDIIVRYAKNHSNIFYQFHEENSGNGIRAANEIIDVSKEFDYVCFFSDDDAFIKNSIEISIEHAEKYLADWLYGDLDVVDGVGRLLYKAVYNGYPESVPAAIASMWRTKSLDTTFAGTFFRSKFLLEKRFVRLPNTTYGIDAATAIDWYAAWPTIKRAPYAVHRYRIWKGGETAYANDQKKQFQTDLISKMISVFGYENIMACLK